MEYSINNLIKSGHKAKTEEVIRILIENGAYVNFQLTYLILLLIQVS